MAQVLDFPEFIAVLSRLICESLDVAVRAARRLSRKHESDTHRASSSRTQFIALLLTILNSQLGKLTHLHAQPDIDEDAMKATFDSWDKDGDGLISANDLREVVASYGEEWSDENVNDMIYYKKNNGVFSFQVRPLVPLSFARDHSRLSP